MNDTIKHHLSDELLLAYAAGHLSEAFNLFVAAHLSLCDKCRATVEGYEALGGAVLHMQDAPLSEESFAKTWARIAQAEPISSPAPQHPAAQRIAQNMANDDVLPAPVIGYVGGRLSDVKWRPVGMGVKQSILLSDEQASIRLISIPAGAALPDHGHHGTEMTLVLRGAFSDGTGRYGRGDVEIATEDMVHTPRAEPGEECICLVATDARLKFTRMVPRIMQRFVQI